MRAQGVFITGGLAVVGLIAAYMTWQREPEDTSATATVLDINKRELEKVRYEDQTKWLELTRREGEDNGVWVRSGFKELPDAGTPTPLPDGGMPPAPPPKPPDRTLIGNEVAEKLFQKFAPLQATRALGVVEESKLEELGLKTPVKHLTVTAHGREEPFDLGTSAIGITSAYARSKDGKVYLLVGGIASELDMGASRLQDRRLHTFTSAEYDGLNVTVQGKTREFVVVPGAVPTQNKLAAKSNPSVPDDFTRNWSQKIWMSSATELLGKGETPPGGEPTPHFRIDYFRGGKKLGYFEAAPVGNDVYARTEHTASWVKLQPGGEGILVEADRVMDEARK
ncbi:MAG: DUF4340 domain-containing protein [Myxococcaceae bacterium]